MTFVGTVLPTQFVVVLPWPQKELKPNGGASVWARMKAKQDYRDWTKIKIHNAWVAQWPIRPKWKAAKYSIKALCGKTRSGKRRPDEDNLIASLKCALDGLQAVGIIENDRGLSLDGVEWIETKAKESLIELTVWESPA